MKLRSSTAWLLVLTAIVGLGTRGSSQAQEESAPSAVQPLGAVQPRPADPFARGAASIAGNNVRANVIPSIRAAAVAVRDAKGDEAKGVAQAKLNEHLASYFDDDMARREEELKQIEQRLVKLRALLDRRRNSKQEIIELQTKVALNEAEGLGFYEGERADDPNTLLNAPMLTPGQPFDDVRF